MKSMKDVDPNIGEQYRGVIEECMTDDEKQRFRETWNNMSEKEKKLKQKNIWKFLKHVDISMSTIRKIRRRMKQ